MPDIFDKLESGLSVKQRNDIFDKISISIFSKVKKDLPDLLKKYIPPEKPSYELVNQVAKMVQNEVSMAIKSMPPKIVEKVIEKRIEVEPKKETVIVKDVGKIEEIQAKVKEMVKKQLDEFEKTRPIERFVVGPLPLPDMANKAGKVLTNDGHNPQWGGRDGDFKGSNIICDGIIFEPVPGTYFLLNCKETGELQTTQVTP